jgi:ribosome-associated translation inhibitor RaiA
MHQAIDYLFSGMPVPAAADAASRRRIRTLQAAHGAVTAWEVRIRKPDAEGRARPAYTAEVQARLAGGDVLRAEDHGTDVLAALRLAFNALERLLDADRERARARAAKWLATVRNRLAQCNRSSA